MVDAASTNHTFFFREPQVLDYFANKIVPGLARKTELRIWSAAASTGDEAYTLAMLAAEVLGPEQAASSLSRFWAPISAPRSSNRRKSAVYGAAHLEHMPEYFLKRYFVPVDGGEFKVSPHIQQKCLSGG